MATLRVKSPLKKEKLSKKLEDYKIIIPKRPLIVRLALDSQGEIKITHREFSLPPENIKVVLSEKKIYSRNRLMRFKQSYRPVYDKGFKIAKETGYFEIIFQNEKGNFTEGAISNIFFKVDNEWITPPLSEGLLPGIWREKQIKKS